MSLLSVKKNVAMFNCTLTVILENDFPQQIEIPVRHKRKLSNDIWNDIQDTQPTFKIVFDVVENIFLLGKISV